MAVDFVSHPCSGRVRDVPVPDSERELKSLKISLKICPGLQETLVFTGNLLGGEGRNRTDG